MKILLVMVIIISGLFVHDCVEFRVYIAHLEYLFSKGRLILSIDDKFGLCQLKQFIVSVLCRE
jgi:hypothetical protein